MGVMPRLRGGGGPTVPQVVAVSVLPALLAPLLAPSTAIGMGQLWGGGPRDPGQGGGRTELSLEDECPRPQCRRGVPG